MGCMSDSGFAVFSNDIQYEFKILDNFFVSDPAIESIIFVYSQKNDISLVYIDKLVEYKKDLVVVPFEDYNKIEYASLVEALDLTKTVMVIKDLRFMLKRLDERLSMMQIKHSCYKKIVIDIVPYVVDMWKIYFPYSFFDKTLLGYSHSYAVEAAARNYEMDDTLKNPYDTVDIAKRVKGATFINYSKFFTFKLSFKVYKVTHEELAEYERLRDSLFDTESSIKRVLLKLHKYASSLVPGYNVPFNLNKVYDWKGDVEICRTDLKVDDYLCSEVIKLIDSTNTLVEHLNGN